MQIEGYENGDGNKLRIEFTFSSPEEKEIVREEIGKMINSISNKLNCTPLTNNKNSSDKFGIESVIANKDNIDKVLNELGVPEEIKEGLIGQVNKVIGMMENPDVSKEDLNIKF